MKTKLAAILYVGAEMGSSVKTVFGGITKQINTLGRSMESLRSKESLAFKAMDQEGVVKREEAQLNKLIALQKKAQIEANKSSAGKTEQANLAKTTAAVEKQIIAYDKEMAALTKLDSQLKQNGIDSNKLDSETERLGSAIVTMDRRMAVGGHFQKVGSAIGGVASELKGLAVQAGVAVGALGWLFKSQFLDNAAEFETLRTRLQAASTSNKEAKASFDWILNFAPNAPYQIKEITDAFINLKVRGIDPMKGNVLGTIGDTSKALGKDLNSVVMALANAESGLNRRLQLLGIQTKMNTKKGIETFLYADKAGKQHSRTIPLGSRALIQSTVLSIWNERFHGAMQKSMTTWDGMVTNLQDRWNIFKDQIMEDGLFDFMKKKLGGLLDWLTDQSKNGNMAKWAKQIGDGFKTAGEEIWHVGKKIVSDWNAVDGLFTRVTGHGITLGDVLWTVAAIKFTPLILSVGKLAWALGGVGKAVIMGMGPVGWLVAGVALAVGAAVYEIHAHWSELKADSVAVWGSMKDIFGNYFAAIGNAAEAVFDGFRGFFTGDFKAFETDLDNLCGHFLTAVRAMGDAWSNVKGLVNDGLLHPVTSSAAPSAADVWAGSKAGKAGAPMPTSGVLRGGYLPTVPAAGARTNNVTNHYHVTVNAAPGQDPAKVAAETKARLESQHPALASGALFD